MLSGVIYGLVGIKNQIIHICLSMGYLSSLSVTVLIIYLVSPPVSDAVQGAYLVGITMTGLILGGASVIFKEMTEGLGALLGGFCLSMWLLVLVPGGMLHTTSSIAIFISCFTLVAYATTFSHYTRPYGLIGGISFGGATVTVLGIDCFSKAGLKEFWVYIWNLNGNIFPLGVTTYPLTRGIKVEIAAIIVLFLVGIVSQMKLWKIIKEQREKKAAQRLEGERNLETEELGVGKRIESESARERGEWEAMYGDKGVTLSGAENGTKGGGSTITAVASEGDEIEMAEGLKHTHSLDHGLVSSGQDDGGVTVRVVRDDIPEGHESVEDAEASRETTSPAVKSGSEERGVWNSTLDLEASLLPAGIPRKSSKRRSIGPKVVPLPFTVTQDQDTRSNRSSVATFNDDEMTKQQSKRLSGGSMMRLKRLSRQSYGSSNRLSNASASRENLVEVAHVEEDRSSVAATFDDLTDDEDTRNFGEESQHLERAKSPSISGQNDTETAPTSLLSPTSAGKEEKRKLPASVSSRRENDHAAVQEKEPNANSVTENVNSQSIEAIESEVEQVDEASKSAKSDVSQLVSVRRTLTKESLPPSMSKVVMSYRTNEWAKHLSHAETPDFDELTPSQPVEEKVEIATPVNVTELQQTPENAPIAPVTRSVSVASVRDVQNSSRVSYDLYRAQENRPDPSPVQLQASPLQTPQQRLSQLHSIRSSSAQNLSIGPTLVESPIEDSTMSAKLPSHYPPTLAHDVITPRPQLSPSLSTPVILQAKPTTLLAQRDAYLRSKSVLGFAPGLPITHEGTSSTTGSASGSAHGQIHDSRLDDDNLSLSARRSIIRQSSSGSLERHQNQPGLYIQNQPGSYQSIVSGPPQSQLNKSRISSAMSLGPQPKVQIRSSTVPSLARRESQLSEWRSSVVRDLSSGLGAQQEVERSRSMMVKERVAEEFRKKEEERLRKERQTLRDSRLRLDRGGALSAHQEAMMRLQKGASVDGRKGGGVI